MTTTPTRRFSVKVRRTAWIEAEHPRDRKGRFIEKGATVRVWGGFLATVFNNVGGGRIEVVRNSDGQHVIVHRNYLTVVARPDGSAPTNERDANPASLRESDATADATRLTDPDVKPEVDPGVSGNLYDVLTEFGDERNADLVRQAAADYLAALDNGVPDDEADERDGLLATLDEVVSMYDYDHPDQERFRDAVTALRDAAEVEPPAPGRSTQPTNHRVPRAVARAAEEAAEDAEDDGRDPGYTLDGQVVTVTDPGQAAYNLRQVQAELINLADSLSTGGPAGPRESRSRATAEMIGELVDEFTPEAPAAVEEAPFTRTYGPLREDRDYGTVRTTNGGETTGWLSTQGATYPLDVRTDDGMYSSIMGSRIAGVRLETPPAAAEPEAPPAPPVGRPVLFSAEGSELTPGADVIWTNPDPDSFQTTVRGTYLRPTDDGQVFISYERTLSAADRRRRILPTQQMRVAPSDLSIVDPERPTAVEVEWRTRNEPGYVAPNAKPGYTGSNERSGDADQTGADGRDALPELPADGVREPRPGDPDDVLRGPGRASDGPDRGPGRGTEGTGPAARDVPGEGEPTRPGEARRGSDGGPGVPAADTGADDDRADDGGPGTDRGAGSVPDGPGGVPGQPPVVDTPVRRRVYTGPPNADNDSDGPDKWTVEPLIVNNARLILSTYDDDPEDDGEVGRIIDVDFNTIEWQPEEGDAFPIARSNVRSLDRVAEADDPDQGALIDFAPVEPRMSAGDTVYWEGPGNEAGFGPTEREGTFSNYSRVDPDRAFVHFRRDDGSVDRREVAVRDLRMERPGTPDVEADLARLRAALTDADEEADAAESDLLYNRMLAERERRRIADNIDLYGTPEIPTDADLAAEVAALDAAGTAEAAPPPKRLVSVRAPDVNADLARLRAALDEDDDPAADVDADGDALDVEAERDAAAAVTEAPAAVVETDDAIPVQWTDIDGGTRVVLPRRGTAINGETVTFTRAEFINGAPVVYYRDDNGVERTMIGDPGVAPVRAADQTPVMVPQRTYPGPTDAFNRVMGTEREEIDPATEGRRAILGPQVGTWRTQSDPVRREGIIKIVGDYGIKGEMVATIDGWRGSLGQPGDGNVSVTDPDPQVVLDRLYDGVNGDGAAERTRNEVAQGRPGAPEVAQRFEDLTEGARILVQPAALTYDRDNGGYIYTPEGDPMVATFVSYRPPSTWDRSPLKHGFVTIRTDADDPDTTRNIPVPVDTRPIPAPPALGEEGEFIPEADDSDADYVPDPYAVPVLDRDAARFAPTGLDDFAPAGVMAKVDANIAALRVLRDLRASGQPATPEQQTVLARWAGWGGVAGVFDDAKPEFAARREQIESLLDPTEMRRARRTTVNAHYTDPRVVEQVWGAMRGLGFEDGRVLEPGSGSGTFIGYRPPGADMVGVEWDSTTAAISKYLYPDADIRAESFGDTNTPNDAFDATIGNVPFGRYAIHDNVHNRDGESIHNHFILKSLAMTRPGGIVSVMTSRYTLDSMDDGARRKMFEQADLVGAVRLPNGSHQRIAGTDVIEDLLIFRKRLPGEEPGDDSWLTAQKRDLNGWEVAVNDYFAEKHPERALGEVTARSGRFGGEVAVIGDPDTPDLGAVLGGIVAEATDKGLTMSPRDYDLPTLLNSREGGRYEGNIARSDDGTYTIARRGAADAFAVPNKRESRAEFDSLLGLRDSLTRLLDAETADDPRMDALREELNTRYDAYVTTYGPLNRFTYTKNGSRQKAPMPRLFLANDPKAAVIMALENYTPPNREVPGDKGTSSKASIFTTRAVAPAEVRTTADTPADALTLSMDQFGYINLPAIAQMLDTDEESAREQLGDLVFEEPPLTPDEVSAAEQIARARRENPEQVNATDAGVGAESLREPGTLLPAAEYLSGNVRIKMAAAQAAAEQEPRYQANVEALRAVIPRDLGPDEIQVKVGSAFIDAKTMEDFANDMLRVPSWERKKRVKIGHSGGSIWKVDGNNKGSKTAATEEWGTADKPFHSLLQSMLEQRPISVTKDGKADPEATLAAQEKAEAINARFQEWVWEDAGRSRRLAARYNDQFNALALRTYDGSGRSFPGMSEEWREKVQPHVKNAVERIVNEPTALLAHVVGAGKTAEMVMGSAELKRLGLARKPAIVVPNHMLEQMTREYLEIYPSARVLTAGQGMSATERRQFVAQAAVGDWDVVIMTQGAFEGIPMGPDQIESYIDSEMANLRRQLDDARAAVNDDDAKNSVGRRTVKQMETALLSAEQALRKKLSKSKDLGVSFEQTGIDYLMVDEAHEYSNLRTLSNIRSAGADGADKATDLHMKLDYLKATSRSGRVATFATGTPIRNTVTQAYIMTRYMRPDLLEEAGIYTFDQWAATFGKIVTEMELKPEGKGYRQTERFASFQNVPEFLRMFHTFADVKMAEDLDLPRPKLAGGQAQIVPVKSSDTLRAYVNELGDRADMVRKGSVDPKDDNMLKISGDGRKAALSMALVTDGEGNPYPHEPGKLEAAADKIAGIYEANKDKVYTNPKSGVADDLPGTFQVVFMDLGTPKDADKDNAKDAEAGSAIDAAETEFDGYNKLKDLLVSQGVPAEKIRFMHEAGGDDTKKAEMFAAAREGRISVLIGSSAKMGVGTNMQRRAKALHHIDAPWRPSDVEQRDGRLHRQGNWHMNMGEDVEIYRYVTEGSFDAYMWQTLERKAKFINQVMRGTLDVREIEDVGDTAMSYAEVKAIATGNPDFLDLAKGETLVTKLQRLKRAHEKQQTSMRSQVDLLSQQADTLDGAAVAFRRAAEARVQPVDDKGDPAFIIDVGNGTFDSRVSGGNALREAMLQVMQEDRYGYGPEVPVGRFNGVNLTAQSRSDSEGQRVVTLRVEGVPYEFAEFRRGGLAAQQSVSLGLVSRVDNFVQSLDRRAGTATEGAMANRSEVAAMRERIGRDFGRDDELDGWTRKVERLRAKIARDDARKDGGEVDYDPRIDSDRYDAPITLGSAQTYVPPPEEQPQEVEVLADSLAIGDTVEIVTAEVSGTTGVGEVIAKRVAAGMVFLTVRVDGTDYTRAYPLGTPITKVAAPGAVTGVKAATFERRLEVKDGRVVLAYGRPQAKAAAPVERRTDLVERRVILPDGSLGEVKAADGRGWVRVRRDYDHRDVMVPASLADLVPEVKRWDPSEHPRDSKGRFIETGAEVRIWGGGTGTVLGMAGGGRVRVLRSADQKEVTLDAGNVTVVKTPQGAEVAPDAPSDAPAAPNAAPDATTTTPAPEATPEGARIMFEDGDNGERAWAAENPDGSLTGFVQTDPADPATTVAYSDVDQWADAVDAVNMREVDTADGVAAGRADAEKRASFARPEATALADEMAALDPRDGDQRAPSEDDDDLVETLRNLADERFAMGATTSLREMLDSPVPGEYPDLEEGGWAAPFRDRIEALLATPETPAAPETPDVPEADAPATPETRTPTPADRARRKPVERPVPARVAETAAAQAAAAAAGDPEAPEETPEEPGLLSRAAAAVQATVDQVVASLGNVGRPDGAGTVDDPIDVRGDLDRASTLLAEGKHVRLNTVAEVSVLLDRLAETAQAMEAAGEKADDIDLCLLSVPGTNLFCQQSKGIPRAQMPQLSGEPIPGSTADTMERNKRGRVDVTDAFLARLETSGIGVTDVEMPAAQLKATQSELNGTKVAQMMGAMRTGAVTDATIFVTRDGYVIDGHHRWAAKVGLDAEDGDLGDVTMPVQMLDMEIGEALDFANAFTAEVGIKSAGFGMGTQPTTRRPDATGVARLGGSVNDLVDALGAVELDTDDDTDLPNRLAIAAADYDTAMRGDDPAERATAFLAMSKALTDANNALDNGGTEPERREALDSLASAVAISDANVNRLFPPAGLGGTDPGLDGKVIPDDVAADFLSDAGQPSLAVGGSGARHLIKGTDGQWRLTVERQAFHDAIVAGILDGVPVSDDPTYNFFGGGPASGKGGITRMFPQLEEDAAYINPDDIKFQLPEMQPRARVGDPAASSLVHEESSYLAKVAQAEGFRRKVNVTLDGTGDSSAKAVNKKIDGARAAGYKIDAYYVSVPSDIAVERADWRAKNGTGSDRGRAVPESVIRHAHSAVSAILPEVAEKFDSMMLFDTNVPRGTPPNLVARKEREKRMEIMASGKWQEFLDKAREGEG